MASKMAVFNPGDFSSYQISMQKRRKKLNKSSRKKKTMSSHAKTAQALLLDPAMPLDHRLELLKVMAIDGRPESKAALAVLLECATAANGESLHADKAKQLSEMIQQMEEGPLRPACFIEMVQSNGFANHAHVVLDDGAFAFTVVPDAVLASSLCCGDRVLLEARGRALLHRAPSTLKVGEEAKLERRIDERHVEVTLRGHERAVHLASQRLADKLASGEVAPGATLVVNSRQCVAYDALPKQDGLAHYEHLQRVPVPDVLAERDIGAPPKCIRELSDFIRLELRQPELRRRYGLPRCCMKLLHGTSGAGKTLAIQAIWRNLYVIASEATGVPMDQLPPRVVRLNLARIFSMWLGESDKNLDRFFAEAEQLAEEPFIAPDGKAYQLPVLVVLEEIDGLARARSGGHDGVYDRILTTALQRLDATREELKRKFIIFIGTTNEAEQVDRAFLRRIGGTAEQFRRLDRAGFISVLQKMLRRMPVAAHNGSPQEELRRELVATVTTWLYSPNGSDRGIIEMVYAGSTTPEVRFHRHFMTGAVVDRAVQQAAQWACELEYNGQGPAGLTLDLVVRAFDEQIRSMAQQVNEHNARHYVDVAEGARVATLRRLPQPSLQPIELQRNPTHERTDSSTS
jgi:ATP-dependent 26S proteasome regulatory subunit